MTTTKTYKYQSWTSKFPNGEIDLSLLPIGDKHWDEYFQQQIEFGEFENVEKILNEEITGSEVFPYPDLLFNAFNQTNFEDTRVVILGQDPYINFEYCDDIKIPQAMGLSFSVPKGMKIPPSLNTIFKNQLSNKIISSNQPHGNLQFWANQGCLMINTALTVRENESNSHSKYWKSITDKIIKHLSSKLNDLVFVLWGGDALSKLNLIDFDKHNVIISSHPSHYSNDKPLKHYPPFNKTNHFGLIDKYLIKSGHDSIMWTLF